MNTLSKVYCRTFQAMMKLGHYFLNYRIPETIKGAGSIKRLPAFIRNKGIDRILVVTDAGLMKLGLPVPMLEAMKQAGITCTVYDGVAANPTSDNVEEGLKLYLKNGCRYDWTARQMDVHENTVRYRIKKVMEMMELNLFDPKIRESLLLACLILGT